MPEGYVFKSVRSAHTVAEQQRAIAEIERLGGSVTISDTTPAEPVVSVDFGGTRVTDAGLEHLQGLTELKWLYLQHTQVTDAGLEHLQGLTELKWLWLTNTEVTDAGLKHLKGLSQLGHLHLHGTQVTDAGVKDLYAAFRRLHFGGLHFGVINVSHGILSAYCRNLYWWARWNPGQAHQGRTAASHGCPSCGVLHRGTPVQSPPVPTKRPETGGQAGSRLCQSANPPEDGTKLPQPLLSDEKEIAGWKR